MALDLPDWASGLLGSLDNDIGSIGGFAPSDLISGGMALFGGSTGIVPAKGFGFNVGGPGGITIGTNPVPATNPFAGGGGGGSGGGGAGGVAPIGNAGGVSFHSIREKMYGHLGFRPRRKTVMYLIRTLGFAVASAVLGLDVQDVLFLFMRKRGHSRRHYVQTMVKAIRRGERFRHTLSKYKIPHARHHSANFGQRMAAARRKKKG